ncbi:hypothetical protein [Streptomyces triticiradicis]|uniref:Uncharacterized protein n=1 Tax=Streptomyces triticiradicis TaxID=2651189 RepID=A0A7J5DDM3_9ACTN|nr:hypothetical protein [Streptomyces triticiradicis]KAB1986936.1 hypothetical protein F8144_19925 [Streptomyces triticiradicis]
MSRSSDRSARNRLGVVPDAGAWCAIGRIPEPPRDVHQAAGGGPLRPAFLRPLGLLGAVLVAPFMPIAMLFTLLASGEEALKRLLSTKEERARARAEDLDIDRRDKAIAEQGLDSTFDGDWNKAAGQFLLRWYSHSSHHQRFVVLTEGRIVLAAPPKRVSVRREDRMRVVAEIPAGAAVVEDPLPAHDNRKLRIRFTDGSWLMLTTEEQRSEVHMHLMRQPRAARSGASDV